MALPHSMRHRLSIPNWPRKRRALRHLALSQPPIGLAFMLFIRGIAEREAARRGDPSVLAARAAVRTFFHHRDATSILEHAVTGLGLALTGLFVVQFYYFVLEMPGADDAPVPLWLRVVGTIGVGVPLAALAGKLAYPGAAPYIALLALSSVGAMLNCDRAARRLALFTPGLFIGLVGSLTWANFELAWKISQWPTTRDSASVVLTHLATSLVTLIVCCVAFGATLRRFSWLQPPSAVPGDG